MKLSMDSRMHSRLNKHEPPKSDYCVAQFEYFMRPMDGIIMLGFDGGPCGTIKNLIILNSMADVQKRPIADFSLYFMVSN